MTALPRNFSIYLDAIRFICSMIVFLGHASGKYWTGSLFWQLGMYMDTCVIMFFVLSGFVISFVVDTKESEWRIFTVSRLSRLWSVIIPALAITFAVDTVGIRVAPDLYIDKPWFAGDHLALRYAASFFMLQEVWHLKLVPGTNAPFWSLSYEGLYYLAFGIVFFIRSRSKWLWLAILAVISGPLILATSPIWIAGTLVYKTTKTVQIKPLASSLLFIFGLFGIFCSPILRSSALGQFTILGDTLIPRYFDALTCCANLLGAYGMAHSYPKISVKFGVVIAKIASLTFPLYLFHRPLIQFFSYSTSEEPSSLLRRATVIFGTLIIVWVMTPFTEKLRHRLRNWLSLILRLASEKSNQKDVTRAAQN